jgi:hypothetical protein
MAGDRQKQHELFELFFPMMYSVCQAYNVPEADVENTMIAGFVAIFQTLHTYTADVSFENWCSDVFVTIIELAKNKAGGEEHEELMLVAAT